MGLCLVRRWTTSIESSYLEDIKGILYIRRQVLSNVFEKISGSTLPIPLVRPGSGVAPFPEFSELKPLEAVLSVCKLSPTR